MKQEQQEHLDAREDSQLRGSAARVGLSMAADAKERTVHNEDFLKELLDTDDLDTDELDITDDLADWFADIHGVTNRGDQWDQMADLLLMNKRERAVAERRPGRLLRDRPFLLATMQDADTPTLDAYRRSDIPASEGYWLEVLTDRIKSDVHDFSMVDTPVTSAQQSRIYGAAEAAADLWAMSRNALGVESVSTVKTETNVRRQEQEDSTKERLGRVME